MYLKVAKRVDLECSHCDNNKKWLLCEIKYVLTNVF